MANLLYRLGRFAYRRLRLVASIWAVALVLIAAGALTLGGRTVDAFSIPGTESQQALDDLRRDLPDTGGATLTVVLRAPAGNTLDDPAMTPAVAAVMDRAAELADVVKVVDPYTSGRVDATETIGLISVSYTKSEDELTSADREAFDELAAAGGPGRLRVVPGGISTARRGSARSTRRRAIATVVLMVTFGSLLAAGMTLLTALVGVLVGMCGLRW